MFASVLYIQLTLENGQRVIRDRALLRAVRGSFFIDSVQADVIKILLRQSEDTKLSDDKFAIFIFKKEEEIDLPKRFLVEIGDVILDIEKIKPFEFYVKDILRGGFIKAGNEVKIVKF